MLILVILTILLSAACIEKHELEDQLETEIDLRSSRLVSFIIF